VHFWTYSYWQYIVPILSLFHGRVINKPEEVMPASEFSTGGDVEHEVSPRSKHSKIIYAKLLQIVMIGGILFFVIEAKLGMPTSNNLAQLFLELLCASSSH
jgi:hypothetical protein